MNKDDVVFRDIALRNQGGSYKIRTVWQPQVRQRSFQIRGIPAWARTRSRVACTAVLSSGEVDSRIAQYDWICDGCLRILWIISERMRFGASQSCHSTAGSVHSESVSAADPLL